MKKYSLLPLLIMSALNGMDNQNMELSNSGLSQLLKIYNIPIADRAILHIGCTVGKVSTELAQKASRIHVFDQNKEFIDTSINKYQDVKNITFEHCNSIAFNFPRQCNLAIIDYTVMEDYMSISEHRKELFQCINQHLSQDGEIFLSIATSDNTPHPTIDAAKGMAPTLAATIPNMTEDDIIRLMIPQYPSTQDLLAMLEETDFEIITHEEQIITRKISKDNFSDLYTNTITQNPIYKCIEDPGLQSDLAHHFVKSYLKHLHQFIQSHLQNMQMHDHDCNILEPTITTIIRARKK